MRHNVSQDLLDLRPHSKQVSLAIDTTDVSLENKTYFGHANVKAMAETLS
jgi:hypothetical protein